MKVNGDPAEQQGHRAGFNGGVRMGQDKDMA